MNNDQELFRQALQLENDRAAGMKMPADMEQRVMKRIGHKSASRRWLYVASAVAVAASVLLLLTLHDYQRSSSVEPVEQPLMVKETVKAVRPQAIPVEPLPRKARAVKPRKARTNSDTAAESLEDCIARLEAEMESLDDSVSTAQVDRLIAADARLQQLVYRIVGQQTEQTINELRKDSSANYISF